MVLLNLLSHKKHIIWSRLWWGGTNMESFADIWIGRNNFENRKVHCHRWFCIISGNIFFFFRPELEQKNHLFTQIVIQSTGDRICFIKTRTTTTGNSPCINFTNRRSSINRLEGKMTYKEGHMHRFLRRWVSLRFASGHLFLWVAFTSELSPLRARFNP